MERELGGWPALRLGEAQAAVHGVDRGLGLDVAQHLADELGIGHGVDHGEVRTVSNHRSRPVLARSEEGERKLIEVMAAGGEAGLDHRQQQRRLGGEYGPLLHLERRHVARLGGKPALALQPGGDRLKVELAEQGVHGAVDGLGHPIASSPSSTSWNQKKPRGARVSR